MSEIEKILLFTTLAGACIPFGGVLALTERIHPRWLETEFRHFVIAFGGGVLVGAVALVLVPEGLDYMQNEYTGVIYFIVGGLVFFGVEWLLGMRRKEAPQLTAMLLDYLPESMALGGIFALGSGMGPFFAVLIGLQNVPEGFNAYRELIHVHGKSRGAILLRMCLLVLLGPLVGVIGWAVLSEFTQLLGGVMLFAAGGILYLIFQDIAPQSKLGRHWAPPLGAILGFGFTLFGHLLTHG
jgi:ZIP family zinc transporter